MLTMAALLEVAVGEGRKIIELVEADREHPVVHAASQPTEERGELGVAACGSIGPEQRQVPGPRAALFQSGQHELFTVGLEEQSARTGTATRWFIGRQLGVPRREAKEDTEHKVTKCRLAGLIRPVDDREAFTDVVAFDVA